MTPVHNKILFIGPMGAGKTTAIQTLSDDMAANTEVRNSNRDMYDKATTTVAMDYGAIQLDDEQLVHLYGIPGQKHFEAVWPVIAKGAIGAILLVNASQPDWQNDMLYFLNAFPQLVTSGSLVVAINRGSDQQQLQILELLSQQNLCLPVLLTDPRDRGQLVMTLEILIANLEIETLIHE
ncbi:GTP-binding protein [Oceanobacter mangrovi]|uniref:GTP-binding protein n=1 Tax=Oceanobacter mangrovi TaxID=2862510 RepID=UPI001C8EBD8D|nr:ATP/GTP-binding protein [Oceanobacter mangrovi]